MALSKGDIVVVTDGDLRGQIGIVQGEGNFWDYTVEVNGETYRLMPEQLSDISLETLIYLATPVPGMAIELLRMVDRMASND